jgi:hypothetical protein
MGGGVDQGLGAQGDLQPTLPLDFKPRSWLQRIDFSLDAFFAPSLLLHHFFLSIDIGTTNDPSSIQQC